MDKDNVINELRDKKGMIYVPKILCFATSSALDIAVYAMLDTLIHFSEDNAATLNTIRIAKDFDVEEKKILSSLNNLEELKLIKGIFVREQHNYVFTINYERLLELNEWHEGKKEEKKKIIEREKQKLTKDEEASKLALKMLEEYRTMSKFKQSEKVD